MNPNQIITFIYTNPYTMFLLATWVIVWKGMALWKAARNNSKYWFVILLIINSVGLFEILYIFFLSKIDFANRFRKLNLSHLLPSFKKGSIK
jgi:hypothetical protein